MLTSLNPWLIFRKKLNLSTGSNSNCTSEIFGSKVEVMHLWKAQCSEPDSGLYFSIGFYCMTPWIRASILSGRAIPQGLHRSLIFFLPLGGNISWQLFLNQCSLMDAAGDTYNVLSSLHTHEHTNCHIPSHHMLVFLVVYNSSECSLYQYIWLDLKHISQRSGPQRSSPNDWSGKSREPKDVTVLIQGSKKPKWFDPTSQLCNISPDLSYRYRSSL